MVDIALSVGQSAYILLASIQLHGQLYVPTNEGDQEMQSNCAQEGEDIW